MRALVKAADIRLRKVHRTTSSWRKLGTTAYSREYPPSRHYVLQKRRLYGDSASATHPCPNAYVPSKT